MTNSQFLNILRTIQPGKHIISGKRGSEENVKIKIIIPLLQFLGYNIVKDLDFEVMGADVNILNEKDGYKPILIVETKAWEQQIKNYLNQCLEYTLKLRVPFILISSGEATALYSSLINPNNLASTQPIIEFGFTDLLGKEGETILKSLYSLIGKENLLKGADSLYQKVAEQLSAKNIDQAREEFLTLANNFKSSIKTVKINDNDFDESAKKHPKEIYQSLIVLKKEFSKIAEEFKNVRLRYRSREIGLEYLLATKPRSKVIGLIGIYPIKAKVAISPEGWQDLKCPPEIIDKLKAFSRFIKNKSQVDELVSLLRMAIKSVK